jgi:hypothetical protein
VVLEACSRKARNLVRLLQVLRESIDQLDQRIWEVVATSLHRRG